IGPRRIVGVEPNHYSYGSTQGLQEGQIGFAEVGRISWQAEGVTQRLAGGGGAGGAEQVKGSSQLRRGRWGRRSRRHRRPEGRRRRRLGEDANDAELNDPVEGGARRGNGKKRQADGQGDRSQSRRPSEPRTRAPIGRWPQRTAHSGPQVRRRRVDRARGDLAQSLFPAGHRSLAHSSNAWRNAGWSRCTVSRSRARARLSRDFTVPNGIERASLVSSSDRPRKKRR